MKLSLIAGLCAGVSFCGSTSAQVTQRVSVSSSGIQGNDYCEDPSISADGRYVAFHSLATNLIPGDTNGTWDIFVCDRQLGGTERVSLDSSGTQANGLSAIPSISADGRYVAFRSDATNLVLGDTNGVTDIFVRDRQLGVTERASVDSTGSQGNGNSIHSSISVDGRYVAFQSVASNLVLGDTNGREDVFIRDLQLGATERVSIDSAGMQGNESSDIASVSGDGRYVAFRSFATNLVSGDTNGWRDVFVRDRQLGVTERVSVDSNGVQGNDESEPGSLSTISMDGRYVAFESFATNLVSGDTNGRRDSFVRDRQLGVIERVSIDSGGAQGNDHSYVGTISVDARYVAFESLATNLVGGDTNGKPDVFLHDRQSGATERISVDSNGTQGNGDSGIFGVLAISASGRFVAFASYATNLVSGDTNSKEDVFVRDRGATSFTGICDPGQAGVVACPCSNPPAGSGRGCDNFGAGPADSGTLTATGVAYLSMDTVLLTATGENNTSLTVFWTGMGALSPTGVAHGAGVRCVTQVLKRMYTHSASGGTVSAPVGADLSVSAQTAQLYGTAITAGETRYYFTIYRDPQAATPCGNTSSTVNLTNAGSITWNL